jgi:hypothetical protein
VGVGNKKGAHGQGVVLWTLGIVKCQEYVTYLETTNGLLDMDHACKPDPSRIFARRE